MLKSTGQVSELSEEPQPLFFGFKKVNFYTIHLVGLPWGRRIFIKVRDKLEQLALNDPP